MQQCTGKLDNIVYQGSVGVDHSECNTCHTQLTQVYLLCHTVVKGE
jgi:hypothetical protein